MAALGCRHVLLRSSALRFILQPIAVRHVFAASALGIDGYLQQRQRANQQFRDMRDTFISRMKTYLNPDNKQKQNMIFSEDLKNMLYLVDSKPEEIGLVVDMMKRFNSQNKELRFASFTFGPVVMRTLHHLNLPDLALQLARDPELDGFFDQLTSYILLMDLLYKNERYKDIRSLYDTIKERNVANFPSARDIVLVVSAACYKESTPEALNYVVQVLQQLNSEKVVIGRKAVTYASALALKQNNARMAYEILSLTIRSNYYTVQMLKVMSLANLDRVEEALAVLRNVLDKETTRVGQKPIEVAKEALEEVRAAIQRTGKKDHELFLKQLEKRLQDGNHISQDSFEAILCSPIEFRNTPQRGGPTGGGGDRQFPAVGFTNRLFPDSERLPPRRAAATGRMQGLRDVE